MENKEARVCVECHRQITLGQYIFFLAWLRLCTESHYTTTQNNIEGSGATNDLALITVSEANFLCVLK